MNVWRGLAKSSSGLMPCRSQASSDLGEVRKGGVRLHSSKFVSEILVLLPILPEDPVGLFISDITIFYQAGGCINGQKKPGVRALWAALAKYNMNVPVASLIYASYGELNWAKAPNSRIPGLGPRPGSRAQDRHRTPLQAGRGPVKPQSPSLIKNSRGSVTQLSLGLSPADRTLRVPSGRNPGSSATRPLSRGEDRDSEA